MIGLRRKNGGGLNERKTGVQKVTFSLHTFEKELRYRFLKDVMKN